MEVDLKLNGIDLKQVISEKSKVEVARLKVISSGRVLEDSQQLQNQGIKVDRLSVKMAFVILGWEGLNFK